ncbi:hypothetical protein AALO_G00151680 [Alosa alosa]|uniref:Uncharacterized protein n=1 Tax=Alosa alosa TaxID=278164 RepID=A0AAV6GJ26_9TELE|nr:hypothetical protein AALO_G00151680 [Alosa alosa]
MCQNITETCLRCTVLFHSSPCRWLIWRKVPPALTGLTARTGLRLVREGLEMDLSSSVPPSFPKRTPLPFMLLLLREKDLYSPPSRTGVFPRESACRSPWEVALRDMFWGLVGWLAPLVITPAKARLKRCQSSSLEPQVL